MAKPMQIIECQHLAWRAGFGASFRDLEQWSKKDRKEVVHHLLNKPSAIRNLEVIDSASIPDYKRFKDMSAEERKQVRKLNVNGIKDLNTGWIKEMAATDHPFQEKMAVFWHGHFACRTQNVLFNQQLLQVIRSHATGNFGDLLIAVSKTPAMLAFLNNQQNRKQHPNENFAREVMELFTMGRGNYSETDVKEAARAFTGWGFNAMGEFVFRAGAHDEGKKTILGKTGFYKGDDVLAILLDQPATAKFIARKIYKEFVNEEVDENHVNEIAGVFYKSNYDIKSMMRHIFTADWFYDEKNIGAQIKSPVDLLIGLRRSIPMQFEDEAVMLLFQRVMGQLLFYPPNVAGWPGGKSWIDSSSLMFRMRVPQIILYAQAVNVAPKELTPEMGEGNNYKMTLQLNRALQRQYAKKVQADIDWASYIKQFEEVPRTELSTAIAKTLIGLHYNKDLPLLEKYADESTREQYIKTFSLGIMSTPLYQLC